mmetsp:Transcript_42333/g.70661  ORF Transcript_42333/g.70661 Transcript_42333/m.70661 type:complete len:223 (+) Transcript_42333:1521-2189(+)
MSSLNHPFVLFGLLSTIGRSPLNRRCLAEAAASVAPAGCPKRKGSQGSLAPMHVFRPFMSGTDAGSISANSCVSSSEPTDSSSGPPSCCSSASSCTCSSTEVSFEDISSPPKGFSSCPAWKAASWVSTYASSSGGAGTESLFPELISPERISQSTICSSMNSSAIPPSASSKRNVEIIRPRLLNFPAIRWNGNAREEALLTASLIDDAPCTVSNFGKDIGTE